MFEPPERGIEGEAGLIRSLSTLKLFSISFGSIVGVGWITLVGIWLEKAGPFGTVLAFGAGFLTVCLVAMVYLELATSIPKAGAEVAYAERALGPQAAFAVGWALLLIYLSLIAFFMISSGWILGVIWPAVKGPVAWHIFDTPVYGGELAVSVAALVMIAGWNIAAANVAASAQTFLMALKLGVTALFIVTAAMAGDAGNLHPLFAGGDVSARSMTGMFSVFATSLLFFSGFNYLSQAMEETDGSVGIRKIKLALFGSIFLAYLFYAGVILATGVIIPRARLHGLELPAADAFQLALGSVALRNVVLGAGLIGILTAWNGTLFAAGRVALLLARLDLIPVKLGRIHARHHTPANALLLLSLVGGVLGCLGRSAILPLVSVAAALIPLTWIFVSVAAIILRRRLSDRSRPHVAPFGKVVLYAALIVSIFAFMVATIDALGGSDYLFTGCFLALWLLAGGGLRLMPTAHSTLTQKAIRQ
jgi:amino acid transporter